MGCLGVTSGWLWGGVGSLSAVIGVCVVVQTSVNPCVMRVVFKTFLQFLAVRTEGKKTPQRKNVMLQRSFIMFKIAMIIPSS